MTIELESIFSTWAGGASHLIGDCFDCSLHFIDKDYSGLDPYVRFVNSQLYIDCQLSSESVLLLIREGKEWDADLVNRAVMEGTLKYVYMMLGESDELKQKAIEYWDVLPSLYSTKRSERLKSFLMDVPDPENMQWRPFRELLLSEDGIISMRRGMNRNQRMALEEKWSFSGIMKQLKTSGRDELKLFAHLAHGYGMSSHLIHKDGDGVGMVWDRYTKDTERQVAAKLGHAARIVSDVCAFAKLRLIYLFKACREETKSITVIEERYEWLTRELEKANSHFNKAEYGET